MALLSLILCYLIWGLFPIFWKQLAHVPPLEILFHRILWSFVFYGLMMFLSGQFSKKSKVPVSLGNQGLRVWIKLLISSTMITGNWFLYIYAVNSGQILQGSLAYYLSPLINVLVGALYFKETLNNSIRWALVFCGAGVFTMAFGKALFFQGTADFPLLALGLAFSFSTYGLIKKTVLIPAVTSSFIEGLFFILPSVYFIFFSSSSRLSTYSIHDWIYLVLGGIVTGLPLIFFSFAAQRLPMTTVGFFQYLSPTLQLLTAIFIYSEDFGLVKIVAFSLIWVGVFIYIYYLLKRRSTELTRS